MTTRDERHLPLRPDEIAVLRRIIAERLYHEERGRVMGGRYSLWLRALGGLSGLAVLFASCLEIASKL